MVGEAAPCYDGGQAWYEAKVRRHVLFAKETEHTAKVLVLLLTGPGTPVRTFEL